MCVPPISVVEVILYCLELLILELVLNTIQNVIKYCAQDVDCTEVDGLNSAAVKAIVEEAKLSAEFKMCITGSKWLEILSAFGELWL